MAYEYEKENIIKVRHFNIMTGSSDISKPTEELQEVYRKAKAFDGIYKFLSNSPIEPFFKEYLERIANELEDNNND